MKSNYQRQLLYRGIYQKVGLFMAMVLLLAAAVMMTLVGRGTAATNSTLNFQARLQNASGGIVADGYYNIEFKLYAASSGGSALWTESYLDTNGTSAGNDFRVRVKNGYVSVNLGSLSAFPGTISWDQELWLTMNIGGTGQTASPSWDGEMNPRLKITSVPYAFRAGQLAATNGTYTSTLSLAAPSGGNQNFVIPDQGAAGTYSLLTQNMAAAGFIQNSTSPQTANFNVSGNGVAGGYLDAAGGFRVNGVSGLNGSCSGGQVFQNATVAGGIVTSGTCATVSNGVTAVGALDSQTKNGNGGVIVGTNLYLQTADGDNPGLVSAGAQTLGGSKTFTGNVTIFRNASDSLAAFRVQNAAGSNVFYVDTSNGSLVVEKQSGTFAGLEIDGNAYDSNVLFLNDTTGSSGLTAGVATDGSGFVQHLGNRALNIGTNGRNDLQISASGNLLVGGGSFSYFPKLYFGDPGATLNNAWIAEFGNTDSDRLQIQGRTGVNLSVGNSAATAFKLDGGGAATFQNASDSASAFQIQDAGANQVLNVDTVDGRVLLTELDAIANTGVSDPQPISRVNRTNASTPSSSAYGSSGWTPSGSFTPSAGTVLVAYVLANENCSSNTYDPTASQLTVSGGGLTWSAIDGSNGTPSGNNCDLGQRAFYAVVGGSPPSNMQVTVDSGSFSVFNYAVIVDEYSNVDTSSPVAGAVGVTGGRLTNDFDTWTANLGATPSATDWKMTFAGLNSDPDGSSDWATASGWTTAEVAAQSRYGSELQVQYQTGSTSTILNYAAGNVPVSNATTSYGGFILKQSATGSGPASPLNIGMTNATTINLGGTSTAIKLPSLTNCTSLATDGAGKLLCNSGADVAEVYYSRDASVEPGDVVSLDASLAAGVRKADVPYATDVMGVVSTKPGLVLDDHVPSEGIPVRLGLVGRVPVKVSTANGPIRPGDALVASGVPGVAMRATEAGMSIGTAMEAYDGLGTGLITVFLKSGLAAGSDAVTLSAGSLKGLQAADATLLGIGNADGNDDAGGSELLVADSPAAVVSGGMADGAELQRQVDDLRNVLGAMGSELAVATLRAGSLTVSSDAEIRGRLVVRGAVEVSELQRSGDNYLSSRVNTRQATIKHFTVSLDVKAGQIVVLDDRPGYEGQVTTTDIPEDTRVIGVAVTQAKAGGQAEVAIGGWVEVRVRHGQNAEGRLLPRLTPGRAVVTSDKPGRAYTSDNPKAAAIIGKTTGFQDDRNMVWLLITF